MKRALWVLLLVGWISLSWGGFTFLRQYQHPGEVITKVNTVKYLDNGRIILALEGYHTQTNEFFSRIQSFDGHGSPLDEYADAYVGEPLQLSSGIFENGYGQLLTPLLTELPLNQFQFRWQSGYPDHNCFESVTDNLLPDSIDTIVEFSTATNSYEGYASWYRLFLVAGRAIVNGVYRCFALNVDTAGNEIQPIKYFPGLIHISGIARTGDGYVAIGQASGWAGKIVQVDSDDNVVWQQNFTDGADATQTPMFTTPLLASSDNDHLLKAISYQGKDRVLHIGLWTDQNLQTIYSEQLDGYAGAIPLSIIYGTVTFAYVKNGVQIIRKIDAEGNTIWVRELPGIGNFGKNSLDSTIHYALGPIYIWISGRMADGGYYLALLKPWDGSVDYDSVSQPEHLKLSFGPNPCAGDLNLRFELKQPGKIKLELYNLKGQKVETLMAADYPSGKFVESVNISSLHRSKLPSGIYLLRLTQGGRQITRKLFYQYRTPIVPPTPVKH